MERVNRQLWRICIVGQSAFLLLVSASVIAGLATVRAAVIGEVLAAAFTVGGTWLTARTPLRSGSRRPAAPPAGSALPAGAGLSTAEFALALSYDSDAKPACATAGRLTRTRRLPRSARR